MSSFAVSKSQISCIDVGVRKHHGHSIRSLTKTIFTLPFVGKNFFRGIILNSELPFGKDAAYELLKGETYVWRQLLLALGRRLFGVFDRLTSDERKSLLIIDDSSYDRSRSKWVELLASVWDHRTGRFLKGFGMLIICWSDGTSCLPMGFALLSSTVAKKLLCDSQKAPDKRCCAYQRCKKATEKATAHLEIMGKQILAAGVSAKYLLMDSWFTMPAKVIVLARHIKVIGMVKNSSLIYYTFKGRSLNIMAIYRKFPKCRWLARILASASVLLKNSVAAKLVFARDRRKKEWLALLSTDTDLADEDIVRINRKRWDIEIYHCSPAQIQGYDIAVFIFTFVF